MLGFRLSVSNYADMLTKLAWFIGINCLVSFSVIANHWPALSATTDQINAMIGDFSVPNLGIQLSFSIIVAIAVALFSHAIRLHDRISDILNIRSRFDIDHVIIPSIALSGANISAAQFERINGSRKHLMKVIFYRYNSSGDGDAAVVSSHTRKEALTSWSWYWVALETIFVQTITAVICFLLGAVGTSTIILGICILIVLFMNYLMGEVRRYAFAQVLEIVADAQRRDSIAKEISASL